MAMVAAPFDLPTALAESTHGAGGAQMDPRAPASAVEVVFREFREAKQNMEVVFSPAATQ